MRPLRCSLAVTRQFDFGFVDAIGAGLIRQQIGFGDDFQAQMTCADNRL